MWVGSLQGLLGQRSGLSRGSCRVLLGELSRAHTPSWAAVVFSRHEKLIPHFPRAAVGCGLHSGAAAGKGGRSPASRARGLGDSREVHRKFPGSTCHEPFQELIRKKAISFCFFIINRVAKQRCPPHPPGGFVLSRERLGWKPVCTWGGRLQSCANCLAPAGRCRRRGSCVAP